MIDRTDPATVALIRAIAGQYRIDREIGRGGMGVVYLGVDEQLERPVAIKTLPPHLAADARVRDRFLREARTAGALSHPNIVPIYAAAERDNVVFFAMRFINGESLAERIARVGTLPAGEVVSLLRQLASALHYAHANGVVHRDIKAENVLLDSETGRAMLTDFGIARLIETQALTATGTVLGTVQYMSPEQVSGYELDGRSDLYSLGILAFLALCGRFPFERPTASAIVVAHVTSAPPKLCSLATNVPSALGDIVDRLLSKSPADRFEDGQALRAALDVLPIDNTASLVSRHDSAPLPRGGSRATPATLGTMSGAPIAGNAPQDTEAQAMSSADARQIWARAAELQAHTGMIVPPSEFALSRAAVSSDTTGFSADIVRASAVDAGIDARYVDRALEERRIATVSHTGREVASIPILQSDKPHNWFLGARTNIEMETSFGGELTDFGFEEVAEEIRRSLSGLLTVSAVGRTLTVTSAGGGGQNNVSRQVQIYLTSRNGRTNVRALEDLKQTAIGLFVGGTFGGGIGAGMGMMGAVLNATRNGALAVAALSGTLAAAYGVAVKRGYPTHGKFAGWVEVARSFAVALPGLLIIAIILVGILSGVFTATESAATAVLWALIVTTVVYRSLSWKDFIKSCAKA
ncbi:MAG: protein kinase, partial [Phycisphaerae bacterium]|nr:protein kinase [Gemmatimonadaceae bacterium]